MTDLQEFSLLHNPCMIFFSSELTMHEFFFPSFGGCREFFSQIFQPPPLKSQMVRPKRRVCNQTNLLELKDIFKFSLRFDFPLYMSKTFCNIGSLQGYFTSINILFCTQQEKIQSAFLGLGHIEFCVFQLK